jgi:transposase
VLFRSIKGKKRHILVDTLGLLLHAIVHSAGVQDRDGGTSLLATLFGQFPFLEKLFADSAYQGPIFANALTKILPRLETEIVKRSDHAKGFVQLPKRWIVGVSSEGHAVMSVKVRPELKDSGFEAREAPWRESKTAEPSDNMLERSMREASGCNVQ